MIKRKEGFSGERALVLPASVLQMMEHDILASTLYITDIGFYPNAAHHFRERKEPIAQYVFIYCIEGCGWFKLKGEEYRIEKNQCFILPAHVPHSYGADKNNPWTIYWIHFKGKLAEHYASHLLKPKEIQPSISSRINDRLQLFEEIYHTFEMGYSYENLLYTSSAFHYFLSTICFLQQYRDAVCNDPEKDIINAAIHYMKENIGKKLTLYDVSKHMGYSSSHFSALFNERTGYSPLTYFNQLKIQHACHLLDFTDMKINQVCHKIGISDCYYFSRLFSRVLGMSPSEYKKQKKG